MLPEGAVVINAARGSLLDYEALFDALESRPPRGAGLDVHPAEPVPGDSRLFTRAQRGDDPARGRGQPPGGPQRARGSSPRK